MNAIHIPRRCGARIDPIARDREGDVLRTREPFCRAWAMPNGRCRLHGGLSRSGGGGGPRTDEGRARSLAARVEGRRRWLADLKAKGLPIPFGRKSKHIRIKAEHIRIEAERVAALPPIDRQREAALAALAQMKAALAMHMEASHE